MVVEASARTEEVKAQIHHEEGASPDQQLLTFTGKQLEDGKGIVDYDILDMSAILEFV